MTKRLALLLPHLFSIKTSHKSCLEKQSTPMVPQKVDIMLRSNKIQEKMRKKTYWDLSAWKWLQSSRIYDNQNHHDTISDRPESKKQSRLVSVILSHKYTFLYFISETFRSLISLHVKTKQVKQNAIKPYGLTVYLFDLNLRQENKKDKYIWWYNDPHLKHIYCICFNETLKYFSLNVWTQLPPTWRTSTQSNY